MAVMTTDEYLLHVMEMSRANPVFRATASDFRGAYAEAAKLELKRRGLPHEALNPAWLQGTLNRIRNRQDMAEFSIPALVRILKEYRDLLEPSVIEEIEEALVGFRYWLDEPGEIHACYFTENHQPLYHSAEILVGEMFPDRIFPSDGHTGAWHKEHGKTCLSRWMNWRERFGFSEWLTNYYAEDIVALLGICHYAEDGQMRSQSKRIIDTLLFDLAVNTFQGHWAGAQGRAYVPFLVEPAFESISPICRMYWGEGSIDGDLADCAIMLAIYDYECPAVIKAIGADQPKALINKERMSLNTADAKAYGVDPADFDNIMFFWSTQTFCARQVIGNSAKVMKPNNWMNERINAYLEKYKLADMAGIPTDDDPDFTAMTQADIYTYKTPDYIMSCTQDYRKGKPGYQQQIWGAYLGGRARVFTNHMGSYEYDDRPNFLAGNSYMPRAVQHENVTLCIYRVPADHTRCLETHAYFPQHEFDEVIERDGWVFGRRADAYIALKSLVRAHWKPVDERMYKAVYRVEEVWQARLREAKPSIYHANGHANVWVTELGSKAQNGSFEAFMNGFSGARIEGDSLQCVYHSPSLGKLGFGWVGPLTINGAKVGIHNYPRYDNPYCQSEFDGGRLDIRFGGDALTIGAGQ